MSVEHMSLWQAVEKTPPSETKAITGKAYRGTSPKPYWIVRRATETFGPCGIGWGFTIVNERVENGGKAGDRVHIAHVRVWYKWDGQRGEVEHIGQTMLSGTNKNGLYTDEDAPKKSVTDALVKALSMIGFAGDIFAGRYDDSKYVNELRDEERAAQHGDQAPAPPAPAPRQESKTEFHSSKPAGGNSATLRATLETAMCMCSTESELAAWTDEHKPQIEKLSDADYHKFKDAWAAHRAELKRDAA